MPKRILFLIPYPLHEAPSQRFRFEQYFSALGDNGYEYSVQTFLNLRDWKVFYGSGKTLTKLKAIVFGFAKRMIALSKSPMYDFVFIHREAAPLGPPVFEWIISKVFGKKIIYDFDDAIWLTDKASESWLMRVVKWRKKVAQICQWSYKVSCGNEYLCDFAKSHNENVIYNPTTIDTEKLHNPELIKLHRFDHGKIRIGWTGSHSTLKYLREVEDVLKKILKTNPIVEFQVIADRRPSLTFPVTFLPWNPDTEVEDLIQFDIGIMPLPDDTWAKGKCGFKALQYMALEIPAVASPVGVNSKIVDSGSNGFLCHTEDEWEESLKRLISDAKLRISMGRNGRKKVIENYSVRSNAKTFLSLFE